MPRAEIIAVQIDIVGHSKILVPEKNIQYTRSLLKKYLNAVLSIRQEPTIHWSGDGGWAAIIVKDSDDFTHAIDAIIDFRSMMPRYNEFLIRERIIDHPISIRISVHSMNVEWANEVENISATPLNDFLKNERKVGRTNRIVISESVYCHLQTRMKKHFKLWKYSKEMSKDLFCYESESHKATAFSENSNVRRILGVDNDRPIKFIFHCVQHTEDVDAWPPSSVTGGLSGLTMLTEKIGRISRNRRILSSPYNTHSGPPKDREGWLRTFGFNANLITMDAPCSFECNGAKRTLNWASDFVLSKWTEAGNPNISISMEKPSKEDLRKCPKENKKICIGIEKRTSCMARGGTDKGFIIRARNPYCEDAIILIIAGVHAAASHAGAQLLADEGKIQELYKLIGHENEKEAPMFEAVYECIRKNEEMRTSDIQWEICRKL